MNFPNKEWEKSTPSNFDIGESKFEAAQAFLESRPFEDETVLIKNATYTLTQKHKLV